jgi:WD40 repeat protein
MSFFEEFSEAVARPEVRASFLVALREDAVAKLDRFKARIPNLFANSLRLEHLDRPSARQAIVGPVERFSELNGDGAMRVEPQLVEAVLDGVAAGRVGLAQAGVGTVAEPPDRERVEAPYLQLVMDRIWRTERESGSSVLRLSTLHALGGAEQIVRDHLEGAVATLSPDQKDIAAEIFDHLVTPSGTKIAHDPSDLARYARVDGGELAPVLSTLARARILRPVAGAAGSDVPRYEIYHDVLAEAVLAWRATHETERELARQRDEAQRRHRRLLFLVGAAALLVLVMAGMTVYAFTQRSDARSQARLSRSRELAATADANLDVDPARGLVLGVQAVRLRTSTQAEDALRRALTESRVRLIMPHGGPVTAASFGSDGQRVLTSSEDGNARIWSVSGRLVRRLDHGAPVTAAAFSPDGRLVVTGGADGATRIWHGGTTAFTLRQGGPVTATSFSPDGRLVLTAGKDGTARTWNAATGAAIAVLRHPGPVTAASFSRDGRRIVTIGMNPEGADRRARLWEASTGRLLHTLDEQGVTSATFSPDGRFLATGSQDHTAQIWEVASGRRLHQLGEHQGGVTSVVFGPHGHLVATTSSDGATRVWDARTGLRVAVILGHVNAVLGASFSPDGRFLVTVSTDGTARIWEAATGRFEANLRGHTDVVSTGSFSPNGRLVVTGSNDGTARLWNPGTAPELRFLTRGQRAVYSPGGSRLAVTGPGGTRLVDSNGRTVRRLGGPARDLVFVDGRRLVVAGEDRVLRIVDTADGTVLRRARGDVVDVAAGGDVLATVETDGSARLLSARTLRPLRTLAREGVASVALSKDGSLAATGARRCPTLRRTCREDGRAVVEDARTGAVLHVLRGHTDLVSAAQFSSDGRLLVTASRDHDARVWDTATGAQRVLLRGHFGPVFEASFSPNQRWVVTAGPSTAGLWPVDSGRLLLYLRGHKGPLTSAAFSPDGTSIVTASRDGTVRTYRCELCGGAKALVATARARLGRIASLLTPAERERYLGSAAPG